MFAKDLLGVWLQALSAMGHRGRYFWLSQSLARSSQGRQSWGGLSVFLVPVLSVWQVDEKERALPSLLPSGSYLSKWERWARLVRCWGPTPCMSKPFVLPLQQEKDTSMLSFFTINWLSLAQDKYLSGLVWVSVFLALFSLYKYPLSPSLPFTWYIPQQPQ